MATAIQPGTRSDARWNRSLHRAHSAFLSASFPCPAAWTARHGVRSHPVAGRARGRVLHGLTDNLSESERERCRSSFLSPAPARRFPCDIADHYKHAAQDDRVQDEVGGLVPGQKDHGAYSEQSGEGHEHKPALPGTRWSPSPAIAFRWEPILWRQVHFSSSVPFGTRRLVGECSIPVL